MAERMNGFQMNSVIRKIKNRNSNQNLFAEPREREKGRGEKEYWGRGQIGRGGAEKCTPVLNRNVFQFLSILHFGFPSKRSFKQEF